MSKLTPGDFEALVMAGMEACPNRALVTPIVSDMEPVIERILAAENAELRAALEASTARWAEATDVLREAVDDEQRLRDGITTLEGVLRRAATTAQAVGKNNRPLLDMLALTERLLNPTESATDRPKSSSPHTAW